MLFMHRFQMEFTYYIYSLAQCKLTHLARHVDEALFAAVYCIRWHLQGMEFHSWKTEKHIDGTQDFVLGLLHGGCEEKTTVELYAALR